MKLAQETIDGVAVEVAPLVGAWIEIYGMSSKDYEKLSLPSWERGLKSYLPSEQPYSSLSLPSWERGLKYSEVDVAAVFTLSLPSWERGLKSI